MITFSSSTFSGTESSGVISATVIISGGIVSSRDITVPITFTEGTATGIYYSGITFLYPIVTVHCVATHSMYMQLLSTLYAVDDQLSACRFTNLVCSFLKIA